MVVIGSGDADFVPLVVRLRERGIRMVCVSERSKMGREAVSAYDRVILVGQEQSLHEAEMAASPAQVPAAQVAPVAAKKAVAKKGAVAKAAAKKPAPKKTVARTAAVKKAPVGKTRTPPAMPALAESAASPMQHVDVAAILLAVPALQTGQPQALGAVAKALLDAKLRGKNLTSTKLFKKFPQHFALLPPEKPRTVQYIAPLVPS